MDLGWATTRGRAKWATVLGIVAAIALIGVSLIALNRSVLPFNGWPTEPETRSETQTLPEAPSTVLGGLRNAAPGLATLPGGGGPGGGPVLVVPGVPAAGEGAIGGEYEHLPLGRPRVDHREARHEVPVAARTARRWPDGPRGALTAHAGVACGAWASSSSSST